MMLKKARKLDCFFNGCNISISPIISKSIFAEQEEEEEDNLILIYSD